MARACGGVVAAGRGVEAAVGRGSAVAPVPGAEVTGGRAVVTGPGADVTGGSGCGIVAGAVAGAEVGGGITVPASCSTTVAVASETLGTGGGGVVAGVPVQAAKLKAKSITRTNFKRLMVHL